jgi:precorrin-2 dehydrogenase/sirohydrochlorin ferrochelatase
MSEMRKVQENWETQEEIWGYYPIGLNLRGRLCVVVGGGKVAARKIQKLLAAGAQVKVISPELDPSLQDLKHCGAIVHFPRIYQTGDLQHAFLAIAATDSREVNRKVYEEASEAGVLINVVDNPDLCSFIVPATLQRGNLQISISTSGTDPAGAKKLKETLQSDLEYGTLQFQNAILHRENERKEAKR